MREIGSYAPNLLILKICLINVFCTLSHSNLSALSIKCIFDYFPTLEDRSYGPLVKDPGFGSQHWHSTTTVSNSSSRGFAALF